MEAVRPEGEEEPIIIIDTLKEDDTEWADKEHYMAIPCLQGKYTDDYHFVIRVCECMHSTTRSVGFKRRKEP